jgi:hypothetical protein
MEKTHSPLDTISEVEKTPLVKWLLEIVTRLEERCTKLEEENKILKEENRILRKENNALKEENKVLKEEINAIKKLKNRPEIKPSTLNDPDKKKKRAQDSENKRAGSEKSSKKDNFIPDEEIILQPKNIPEGSVVKEYREFDVQDLVIKKRNIRYKIAVMITPDGNIITGELPQEHRTHFGATLKAYILHQHHKCDVTQKLIHEQLQEFGVNISEGQINNILIKDIEIFHEAQEGVLKAGLETAPYIYTDDTGARHAGKNGYCNVIGNEFFAYFTSTDSKSRENFLKILSQNKLSYVLSENAQAYLKNHALAQKYVSKLEFSDEKIYETKELLTEYINERGIQGKNVIQVIIEASLLGGAIRNGLSPNLIILSDGAPQFNVLIHALCWIHKERPLKKLVPENDQERLNIIDARDALWTYYRTLRAWQDNKNSQSVGELTAEFDNIFSKKYDGSPDLNKILENILKDKSELLAVLQNKVLPLHTNSAENDLRGYVKKRKISGGTRATIGRMARDTFSGIKKTCLKLNQSFFKYVYSSISGDKNAVNLADEIRMQAKIKFATIN